MRSTIARHYFDVAKSCCEIMAYALGAMTEFGVQSAAKALHRMDEAIVSADKRAEQPLKKFFEIIPRLTSISGE